MPFKNTQESYGLVTKLFHWIVGLMIITLIIVGFSMASMEPSTQKWQIYGIHKATGLVVFVLVLIRLLWRMQELSVQLPSNLPKWQKKASEINIFLLYILMLVMPVSGFLMSAYSGKAVSFYGLFQIPAFNQDKLLAKIFNNIHDISAFIFATLIILHISASVYHHFIRKDNVMRRMWSKIEE